MKARKVKGLDPQGPFADQVERIVRVRLDEVASFVPRALDPEESEALHDMRIAAKRLRYLLELTSGSFGPYAATAAKHARDLQDLLGEIHDCDVMAPRVQARLDQLRALDAATVRERAGRSADLDPALVADAPHRGAYAGLELLAVHLAARRALLFDRFRERWGRLEARGWRARLETALAERRPAAGDGAVPGRGPAGATIGRRARRGGTSRR